MFFKFIYVLACDCFNFCKSFDHVYIVSFYIRSLVSVWLFSWENVGLAGFGGDISSWLFVVWDFEI